MMHIAAPKQRDNADQVTIEPLKLVANAVEGENGELRQTIVFVRISEYKDGLARKPKVAAAKHAS